MDMPLRLVSARGLPFCRKYVSIRKRISMVVFRVRVENRDGSDGSVPLAGNLRGMNVPLPRSAIFGKTVERKKHAGKWKRRRG